MTSAKKAVSIQVTNLGKRFNREWIFRNLSYTFSPGNTYAITGANGSGKSTLLQILWGQMPPSTGEIIFKQGDTILEIDQVFRHITLATPYMDMVEEFTLAEQLQFHFKLRKSRNNLTIDEMMERMYLLSARHKFIGNFSSGMKQRLKLAIAFYTEADLIFLDEPGTNLDKQAFDWYLNELKQLPESSTVFIASNDPNEYPGSAIHININELK